jgi:hypothetical protein
MNSIKALKSITVASGMALSFLYGCGSDANNDTYEAGNQATNAVTGVGGNLVTGAGGSTVATAGSTAITTATTGAVAGKGGSGAAAGSITTGGAAGMAAGASGAAGAADIAAGASGAAGAAGTSAGASGAAGVAGTSAGASGAAGAAGTSAGASGAAGAAGNANAPKPPCVKDGNQVVLIGDSYITWSTHTFPYDLNSEAGMSFRNYAQGGYAMATGGWGLIPSELDQAISENPDFVAVVMTGGANDVLLPDTTQFPQGGSCNNDRNSPQIADCQKIVERALGAFTELLDRMARAEVKDVVYFFYPHVPEMTITGGATPNEIGDYARPKYKDACEGTNARTNGKLDCYFLDLIPVLDNEDGAPVYTYFATAGVNPNTIGSARMAEAVWSLMKSKCIAQPETSGCCAK